MSIVSSQTTALSDEDAAAVRRLASDAQAADGVAPLSEQFLLRLQDRAARAIHLLARAAEAGAPLGYAQLDSEGAAELVVAPPARKQGIGRKLLVAVQEAADERPLDVWAHGEHPGASELATELGYSRSRVLLQLRRSLKEPLPAAGFAPDVTVRTFTVGKDEAAWLRINNAAFAHHHEQGKWTLHDVQQREEQAWFDPRGLFLAERDGRLIGFHWTKVHTDEMPPIGEVYVVGVSPESAGQGLGRALTIVGLEHLRAAGLAEVLLYVDEDNTPAMKTYERLGFARWSTDVVYTRA